MGGRELAWQYSGGPSNTPGRAAAWSIHQAARRAARAAVTGTPKARPMFFRQWAGPAVPRDWLSRSFLPRSLLAHWHTRLHTQLRTAPAPLPSGAHGLPSGLM
ncbi:hypothetical protein D0B32_12865 [Paraburkholderia sp. DHOC27]|nr:hypothetical protein D0B32_12865 [Paraburkholderia sp. DHOC27]